MNDNRRVTVVGAGASGMAAAIAAAVSGAHVYLLEANAKPGRKVMASGNGRCNFAHVDLSPGRYNDPAFVAAAMGQDPLQPILDFFTQLGLWYRCDDDGRLFPRSRAAASVLDVLLAGMREHGVELRLDSRVVCLGHNPARRDGYFIELDSGERIVSDSVVWAAGGGSAQTPARCLGLPLIEERPALCPLACSPRPPKSLDGVRVNCAVELWEGRSLVTRQEGEVLFRPYGVSGIVVFDVSRLARPGDRLVLDLLPEVSHDELLELLTARKMTRNALLDTSQGRLSFLDGALHPKIARCVMERCVGADGRKTLSVSTVVSSIKSWGFEVRGPADESHAQVTQGGLDVKAVDPRTMSVLSRPGFYVCGEALDIDGECGGLNLAWAWSSGMVAGVSAAKGAVD